MTVPWKTAWIIGASSGIGRQLSLDLAKQSVKTVVSARSKSELVELNNRFDTITPVPVDVSEAIAVSEAYKKIRMILGPIDLVVFCAAVWHPMNAEDFDLVKAKQSFDINVGGVHNMLGAIMPSFIERKEGQIAIIASVAGYRGLPKSAVYGSTKAALISLAESLYLDLKKKGITISVVNPGFVETAMTKKNDFPMPFIMKPEMASKRIITGLCKRHFEIAFPLRLVYLLKLARILPYHLYFWCITNFILKSFKS